MSTISSNVATAIAAKVEAVAVFAFGAPISLPRARPSRIGSGDLPYDRDALVGHLRVVKPLPLPLLDERPDYAQFAIAVREI